MTELVNISAAEKAAIVEPASRLIAEAEAFRVIDADSYSIAGDRLKAIKGAQKVLDAKKRDLTNPVNATLSAIRRLFQGPEQELVTAENLYKRGMSAWSQEQDELRRKEQARLDAEAERQRVKLAEQAQAAQAKADAERSAGNIEKAEKLEQKANLKQDAAAAVVPAVVQRAPPRVAGVAERENWYALVVSLPELVAAVAAGKVPLTALEPNMKFLNNQAKAMKRELAYPGVRAAVDKIIAAGSK